MAVNLIPSDALPQQQKNQEDLPLVLVHRLPRFKLFFRDRLNGRFRLIDPLEEGSEADDLFPAIRALVTVGPTPVPEELLRRLPRLELVVSTSAGLDKIDLEECRRRGIKVTNASPAFRDDVADYAVGLLIDVLRRVSAGDRFVRSSCWPIKKEYPLGFKVSGKRIGIVGLGNIGSEVAKRLEAFGCSIGYHSRNLKPSARYPYYASVRDLAAKSDVLVLCCALTDETHHIVDTDVMLALGKEGVIINIGRGGLINEKELVRFLVNGDLRGAGLDVFENEPNVPKELLALDNVVLSPHLAVTTSEGFAGLGELVLGNLTAFFENKPLLSLVQL